MKTVVLKIPAMAAADPKSPPSCPSRSRGIGRVFGPGNVVWAAAILWGVAAATPGYPQQVDPNFPVTNGEVFATQLSGNTLYPGGSFTTIGMPSGSFVRWTAFVDLGRPRRLGSPGGAWRLSDPHLEWARVGDAPWWRGNTALVNSSGRLLLKRERHC